MTSNRSQVSLLLYLAGLCVTLSALYAVNFGLEDPSFATLSYCLAIAGYVFSFVLRVRRISLQSVQVPLFVCIALLILANISGSGVGWLMPTGIGDNHLLGLQLLVAWIAIVHTFLLSSDSSVLFACVPGMTMLALVSTLNADPDIQNAFLVFIGAATFMMVHENYLRTRLATSSGRNRDDDRRLFTGQIQLTATCLIGAFVLANIVAVPIRTIGQSLFDPGTISSFRQEITTRKQPNAPTLKISENNVLELAVGPTPESDAPLMRVQCDRGLYWRGTTYSKYTGNSFESPPDDFKEIVPKREEGKSQVEKWRNYGDPGSSSTADGEQVYQIPTSRYDIPETEMRDSQKTKQHIFVVSGIFTSLYGAASVQKVRSSLPGLYATAAGALLGNLPVGSGYEVESQVPTGDPQLLRAASAQEKDIPKLLRDTYLQLPDFNHEDTERLKQAVVEVTQGKTSSYDKVMALKEYISSRCKYNLQAPPAPRTRDTAAWFLFDKQQGYCDCFAATLTVLCRYASIPARMASGFLSGELQGDNTYLVRQKHKHVWTEVFFPHIGWVPFDATEGTVDISDHVNNERHRFTSFGAWVMSHGLLPPMIISIFALLLAYVFKTEVLDRMRPRVRGDARFQVRPQTNQQVVQSYHRVAFLLGRRGLPRLKHQTTDEYASNVARRTEVVIPLLGSELDQLTKLYNRCRYSNEVATQADVERAQELSATIEKLLQQVRPRDFATLQPVVT